jgi:hydrogenase maturation protease
MLDLRQQLYQILQGRVCLVGVGNVELGDDGFGMRLAEALRDWRLAIGDWRVVAARCEPERHLGELTDSGFDTVLFLDAVEFGAEPGAVVLLNSSEMAARFPQISTHKLSLGLLAKMIETSGASKCWLLGAQPASLRQGAGLSSAIQTTLEILEGWLAELMEQPSSRPGVKAERLIAC